MATSLNDIPQELIQKIALYASLHSILGPPKELVNLTMTCRAYRDILSPRNSSDLYNRIFAHKFDAVAPTYRLGFNTVRENAALEMRRRFSAIQTFKAKDRGIDDASLTEAFWIAYLMVEDSDTSQKNVKQLLHAGLPSFLDVYLRESLHEGAEANNGWPVMSIKNSLAIALSWALTSQCSVNREDPVKRVEMLSFLAPIVLAACRYPLFQVCEDSFSFSPQTTSEAIPWTPFYEHFPRSTFPPQSVNYFGTSTRKVRVPSAPLFAILLYCTRIESTLTLVIPDHLKNRTRQQSTQSGMGGPCIEDVEHFFTQCRTSFADYPAIDVGIQSSQMEISSDSILCQPTLYKLGTLSGQWQGSDMTPLSDRYQAWISSTTLPKRFDRQTRKPQFFRFSEHYTCDMDSVVPRDRVENGMINAWLPQNLEAVEDKDGIHFSDAKGTFRRFYKTFRRGYPDVQPEQVVDVIITGKIDDQFAAAWDGANVKVLGRIRMHDGLVVFAKSTDDNDYETRQLFRGYVTSSQNFVGRLKGSWNSSTSSGYEGLFTLSKNHNTSPSESLDDIVF